MTRIWMSKTHEKVSETLTPDLEVTKSRFKLSFPLTAILVISKFANCQFVLQSVV